MIIRDITKNGAFVALIFALVVMLVPFGLEQIGETTGMFTFPVKKTIAEWFTKGRQSSRDRTLATVDWEQYRKALEDFTAWVECLKNADISIPDREVVVIKVEKGVKAERRMWSVPVVSCTPGDPLGRGKGYVFISGCNQRLELGAVIEPSEELCGYEIVSVGERTVWFRAIFDCRENAVMDAVRFPEFTRVDGASLVRRNHRYVADDAFPLASGKRLLIDSFLPPDGAVFKMLDGRRVVATFLCIVIGEKGGL